MELALHHVEEDGDGGLAQLDLRDEGHLQNGTHHLGNELDLVGALWRDKENGSMKVHIPRIGMILSKTLSRE